MQINSITTPAPVVRIGGKLVSAFRQQKRFAAETTSGTMLMTNDLDIETEDQTISYSYNVSAYGSALFIFAYGVGIDL